MGSAYKHQIRLPAYCINEAVSLYLPPSLATPAKSPRLNYLVANPIHPHLYVQVARATRLGLLVPIIPFHTLHQSNSPPSIVPYQSMPCHAQMVRQLLGVPYPPTPYFTTKPIIPPCTASHVCFSQLIALITVYAMLNISLPQESKHHCIQDNNYSLPHIYTHTADMLALALASQ